MASFLDLHHADDVLLLPNAWDVGSAKILADLGFPALATTSSGFAATLGRFDGSVTLDEALDHGAALAAAVPIPVSADFENGFADDPAGVAANVRRAVATGLAGCSIEDWSGSAIYERSLAVERVAAAVEAARAASGGSGFVVTARAENHLHGVDDHDDTVARLQAYAAAGAQCVYAPGPTDAAVLRATVEALAPTPVNVLARPGCPPVPELAAMGVKRVSIGGAFAFAALGALVEAATSLQAGTYDWFDRMAVGGKAVRAAFNSGGSA